MSIRFLTAGESHGPGLTVVVDGLPAGVPVDGTEIDRQMRRRMAGHGRGGRMSIESDRVEITGGVRFGRTLGSPVALHVRNLDFANWTSAMSVEGPAPDDPEARRVTRPRPGHADLAGALKFGTHDARDILERSSARETAARTAAGALARALLGELGVVVTSCTLSVGNAGAPEPEDGDLEALLGLDDAAPMRTIDEQSCARLIRAVDDARAAGDSIGGSFGVYARGVPVGLGSHSQWDRRLDGRLAGALMSIQAVKAVSVGAGDASAAMRGSAMHDPIGYDAEQRTFVRPSNRAGGIEGGMSNGETIRLRGTLKPLATLPRPLRSADLVSKEAFEATRERTDTIPIVAAGVVGEAMVSLVLADEMLRKFGGDSLDEIRRNLDAYRRALADY